MEHYQAKTVLNVDLFKRHSFIHNYFSLIRLGKRIPLVLANAKNRKLFWRILALILNVKEKIKILYLVDVPLVLANAKIGNCFGEF